MAVNLGITHLALGPMLQAELGVPVFVEHDARAAALWLSGQAADPSAPSAGDSCSWRSGPGSRPASSSTGRCSAATTALPARWATSPPIPPASSAPAASAAASRRSPPVRRSVVRPTTRSSPAETPSCCRARRPPTSSGPRRSATPSPWRSSTGWRTAWPRAIRSLALTLGVERVVIGGGVAAAGPALLDPLRLHIARERAASPLVRAALGEASVELLALTEAPTARGAATLARRRISLPEREGVGER